MEVVYDASLITTDKLTAGQPVKNLFDGVCHTVRFFTLRGIYFNAAAISQKEKDLIKLKTNDPMLTSDTKLLVMLF